MRTILFLSLISFVSCVEDCEEACPKWTECAANAGAAFSFETNGSSCKLINRKYGRYYNGIETIIDSEGNITLQERVGMNAQPTFNPSPNYLALRISNWGETDEYIECVFIEPGSGAFNIPSQSIYNSTLATNVFCEGSGIFSAGESNSYSFELNGSYEYDDQIYQMNINGVTE
mgnify:FL=1